MGAAAFAAVAHSFMYGPPAGQVADFGEIWVSCAAVILTALVAGRMGPERTGERSSASAARMSVVAIMVC